MAPDKKVNLATIIIILALAKITRQSFSSNIIFFKLKLTSQFKLVLKLQFQIFNQQPNQQSLANVTANLVLKIDLLCFANHTRRIRFHHSFDSHGIWLRSFQVCDSIQCDVIAQTVQSVKEHSRVNKFHQHKLLN